MRRLALLLFLSCTALAQVRPAASEDISFLVIPKTTVLHTNETLVMKVEVTNIGKDSILFRADDLCLNPGAGLTLRVKDSSNHDLKTSVPLSCVPTPGSSDRDGFVLISPDAFYGRFIRIQASRISSKPGRYELSLTLRGTLSRQDVERVYSMQKTPKTAFTSESQPLEFKFPVQLTP